jgi:hypothetical protein
MYPVHNSTKKPWMVITYGWGSSTLPRLAKICQARERYWKLMHLGKTVWIDHDQAVQH